MKHMRFPSNIMIGLTLATTLFVGSAFANEKTAPMVQGDASKGGLIVQQACASCHGVDGNSSVASNPKLGAQHPEYIEKQLHEFKSGKRKNAIMQAQVISLSDADIKNIAAYFASQKPGTNKGTDAKLVAQGRKIYKGGNLATGLPACAACHGPKGSGMPSQYPRLGAQHASYVVAQLNAYRSGERNNDTNTMMRGVAAKMSNDEIKAVAEYIAAMR